MIVHRVRRAALSGVLLAAACTRERAPVVDSSQVSSRVAAAPVTTTLTGVGDIRVGQPRAAVQAVLGSSLPGAGSGGCDYMRSPKLPPGVKLMLQRDTVVRVDVDSAGVRTAEGAAVGDSEPRVLAMYAGRVMVRPHKYTGPTGHYLVVDDPADSLHRMVFETDGTVITKFRTGTRAAVDLVEGCG